MTSVVSSPPEQQPTPPASARRAGNWIDDWEPENPEFWESSGKQIARRNLIWSIFAEHLGFSVWLLWSVSAAMLAKVGFDYSAQQLFFLVAVPNLVGSLLRLPYTFAVPKFGGRNWTIVSAALLIIPTVLFVISVQRPDTPYWVFVMIAATAGFGGGNFSSSMTNINYFYPTRLKGSALGLNAAGGNIGVSLIQFFLPIIVGAGGRSERSRPPERINLQRVGYLYAMLAVIAAVAAYFFMDNLSTAKGKPRETLAVAKYKHTWIMSLLYVGTFGSFIGYSAAMPLLIKINFFRSPIPTESIGINFVYYAFLGALVGSITRPFGGWLADKIGGAKVTLGVLRRDDRRHARCVLHADSARSSSVPPRKDRGLDRRSLVVPRLLSGDHGRGQPQLRHLPWCLVAELLVRLRGDRRGRTARRTR